MANNPRQPDESQPRTKLWCHIDDFSTGMYDHTWTANQSPTLGAPIGSADANNTWACMSLPSGGLGPLPGIALVLTQSANAYNAFITGFAVNPGLEQGLDTEIIYMYEGDDGVNHHSHANSYQTNPATLTPIYAHDTDPTTGPGIFGSPYPTWTRMYDADGSMTVDYQPVLAFPQVVSTDAHGANGHLYVYPNPELPTTYTVLDLITNPMTQVTGQVVCYDGRILCLVAQSYPWPNTSGFTVLTNENINFTDPPGSETYGNQLTTFAPEEPWGYSAAGSVSNGELFLVKKQGGGVNVNGDIDAPNSVTYYPGVMDGGDFYGRADSSEIGITYCCENKGAYIWNGGNTSQKISMQLRDDFFDCSSAFIQSNNYGFFCQRWNDIVLFSNNYIYNLRNGSWWKLYPNVGQTATGLTGINFYHYAFGSFGNQFYAAPLVFNAGATAFAFQFDNKHPSSHYQWRSLPMHFQPNADHVVDIRRIFVRASTTGTASTITVNVYADNGTLAWTNSGSPISVTQPNPFPYRLNTGNDGSDTPTVLGMHDVTIQVQADSASGSAPLIHSIDIEYTTRAHVPSVN